ncbi:BOI-related E3 ubiquitin-protein ligase 1-like [Silene latifolia]|uniref:BOI-related E3 ubiquitin-protein ligase 1-like n=1 Tax=Silene latifolia TaxID=37657 RepID=UPI003D775454
MAVQAQYPSNVLLLNRNVQESKNGGIGGFLEESHTFFNNNGVGVNPRKRSREDATTKTLNNSLNLPPKNQQQNNNNNNNQLINLSQLQNQNQQQKVVSTGLKLSFGEQKQQQIQHQHPPLISLFSEELAFQFKQHNDELNYFLHAQGEQLKRTLAEKRQRHYCALLVTAKEEVARRLREKEIEVETTMRRNIKLQGRMAQINAEAHAWQTKAMDHEAQVASLKAQIQHVMVSGPQQQDSDRGGLQCAGDADDAGSTYVDPASGRGVNSSSCRACQIRGASVVLLPCRHMCVCVKCDKIVQACPVCYSLRSASVEVYFT